MPRPHEMMNRITTFLTKSRNFEIVSRIYKTIRYKLPKFPIQPKVRVIGKCKIIKYTIVWNSSIKSHCLIHIKQSFDIWMLRGCHYNSRGNGTLIHISQHEISLEKIIRKRLFYLNIRIHIDTAIFIKPFQAIIITNMCPRPLLISLLNIFRLVKTTIGLIPFYNLTPPLSAQKTLCIFLPYSLSEHCQTSNNE